MQLSTSHLRSRATWVALALFTLCFPSIARPARTLTLEERVEAQRAIDRIYYSHQIGAMNAFEEAIPPAVSEQKVRAYLEKSAELHRIQAAPLTDGMLKGEVERMGRETRMPWRLQEIYAALGNDPLLIQECLARPALTDRLLRGRSASPSSAPLLAAGSVTNAEECPPDMKDVVFSITDPGSLGYGSRGVWTGSLLLMWGGMMPSGEATNNEGWRFDPATATLTPMTTVGAPEGRFEHTAIWTGREMIVWGGSRFVHTALTYSSYPPFPPPPYPPFPPVTRGFFNSGGRYNPLTDTWRPVVAAGAPEPRSGHTAVWTGRFMIVFGGGTIRVPDVGSTYCQYHYSLCQAQYVTLGDGGVYAPESGAWISGVLPSLRRVDDLWTAPRQRAWHTAAWTGREMILWGGEARSCSLMGWPAPSSCTALDTLSDGMRFDLERGTWTAIPWSTVAAAPRKRHAAVWTGREMILWGGEGVGGGVRYEAETGTWSSISTVNAPAGGADPRLVWTGRLLMLRNSRYDPAFDAWSTFSQGFDGDGAVWTGGSILTWSWSYPSGSGSEYGAGGSPDADGDGAGASCDCDDTDATVFALAPQICGDLENNDCSHPSWPSLEGTNESDDDGDGFTECQGDLDDANAHVYPGAPEICDGLRNDCGNPAWPALPANEADADGDGYALCQDCNDGNPLIHPGAPEICDGVDNNCDGVVDGPTPTACGVGACASTGMRTCQSGQPVDTCQPGTPSPEICNGIDDDCDWILPASEADADGDGYRICDGDCDDSNGAVHPGALDVPGDPWDQDCAGGASCDPGTSWSGHGAYVSCVDNECVKLRKAGLLAAKQCDAIVTAAAHSQWGGP